MAINEKRSMKAKLERKIEEKKHTYIYLINIIKIFSFENLV